LFLRAPGKRTLIKAREAAFPASPRLFLDVDHFKQVNDHGTATRRAMQCSSNSLDRLRKSVRRARTSWPRLSGDE